MKIGKVLLTGGARQTGREMHRLADQYAFDMAPWASIPYTVMFRRIANLPFKEDPEGHELVQRPAYTMRSGGDCDDKAIAFAAWANLNRIPYRFCAIGTKKPGMFKIPLTHVFAECKIGMIWVPCDCTYAFNIIGRRVGGYDRLEYI